MLEPITAAAIAHCVLCGAGSDRSPQLTFGSSEREGALPPDQLTAFLQHGFGTLQEQSTTLLTLYAASLAFLAAFTDKVLNIEEAPSEVRGWVNVGLYSLIIAVGLVLSAMYFSHAALSQLQLWAPGAKPLTLKLGSASSCLFFGNIVLFVSGIVYIVALSAILTGSVQVATHRRQKEKKTDAEKNRPDQEGTYWA